MKKVFLFYCIIFQLIFAHASNAHKIINCGLITNISLTTNSKLYSPSESDLNMLKSINGELKVSTYMNKAIADGYRKTFVSLFTTGTYDDLNKLILSSKTTFNYKKTIKKANVNFSCFGFKFLDKNIYRIVFNEPELTLCLSIDVITSESIVDYTKFFNEYINRITFRKNK
jgi:hypothetical protein